MPLEKRFISGYPQRSPSMIRRFKRDAVKRELLRQRRPRRHARPWKYRTAADGQAHLEERAAQDVRGSLQERLVHKAFTDRGLMPGVDFTFQSSQLGGRMQLGGLVADFLFHYAMVIVQVQSNWHTMTLRHTIRDQDQKLLLQNMGYTVLEIWPQEIEDPVVLDQWMERNIMHLWGTSRAQLGHVNRIDHTWLQVADQQTDGIVGRLVEIFDKINLVLSGA